MNRYDSSLPSIPLLGGHFLLGGEDLAKKTVDKVKCTCCSKDKYGTRDFYKSASELNAYTGRLNICKECVQERYERLLTVYEGNSIDAFRHLLTNLDEFFDMELYNSCVIKDGVGFIGDYFRQVNGTKDRREKTSINNSISSENVNKNVAVGDDFVDGEIVDFWGDEYASKEYIRLEKKYKKYSSHYPSKKIQEKEIIKTLCEIELMREKCRKTGDTNAYDKLSTQIRKIMEDLNVLPKQKIEDEEFRNRGSKIIELIETKRPVPMRHPEFDDVNGIAKLVNKHFIKPFKRVWGLELSDKNGDNDE